MGNPRELTGNVPECEEPACPVWEHRRARQREIDESIAAKSDFEYLYDKPMTISEGPCGRAVYCRKSLAAQGG